MLVTLSEILAGAERGKYAVIAPDFPSLFIARALIEQAEASRAPLILSYATLFKPMREVKSYASYIRIVREEAEGASVPVALHLDHATDLEDIAEAVDAGFTSVMIDASFEPYEINLERTLKCMEIAHPAGVSVEAELGHVATGEGYVTEDRHKGFLTDPEQAVRFVASTQIDALAVAVGTVHGLFKGKPKLDFKLLEELDACIRIPLVLHGSSGLRNEAIQKAVRLGIRKINVYSDLVQSVLSGTRASLEKQPNNPLKVAEAQVQAVQSVLEKYIRVSGSLGAEIENPP